MTKKCVFGCKDFIHLFGFPHKNEDSVAWLTVLELEEIPHNIRICENHFDSKFVGKKKLLMGAVPNKPSSMQLQNVRDLLSQQKWWSAEDIKFTTKRKIIPQNDLPMKRAKFYSSVIESKSSTVRTISNENSQTVSSEYVVQTGNEISVLKGIKIDVKMPERTYVGKKVSTDTFENTIESTCYCHCHNKGAVDRLVKDAKLLNETIGKQSGVIENLIKQIHLQETLIEEKMNRILAMKKTEELLGKKIEEYEETLSSAKTRYVVPDNKVNPTAVLLVKMFCSRRKNFSVEEKNLSQTLFLTSAKCYNFMRNEMHLNLPHPSSLLRWRPISKVKTGIDPLVAENLKKIVSQFSNRERQCILLFDEMEVRKELEYSKCEDVIDGFEDLGDGKRFPIAATKALVFMIKGTCSNWKYILSFYAVAKAASSKLLYELLKDNINAATDIGLSVGALVCDQGPGNVALYRNELHVSHMNPSFTYNGKKIVCLYDYPHLIKSFRNNLFSNGFMVGTNVVDAYPIIKVFENDSKNVNIKICPKLTERHIHLSNFDKMNVARAVQIFSHTVAAAIESYIHNGILDKSAWSTKRFLETMNNIYDELNVKNIHSSNPDNLPIKRGCMKKLDRLKGALTFLDTVLPQSNTVKCVDGLKQTIFGVILYSEAVLDEHEDVNYILPGKLSQDSLENCFSRFRAQGFNTHPSVREVRYCIARLSSVKVLNSARGSRVKNCESDEASFLDWSKEVRSKVEGIVPIDDNHEEQEIISYLNDFDCPESTGNVVELLAERYTIGYTIFKSVVLKSKCQKCKNYMLKTTASNTGSEAFIKAKNYKDENMCLINPSDDVFTICHRILFWYKKAFERFASTVGLKRKVCKAIIFKMNETCNWLPDDECKQHKLQHLEYMLRVLILKNTMWMSSDLSKEHAKKRIASTKLKKLNAVQKR